MGWKARVKRLLGMPVYVEPEAEADVEPPELRGVALPVLVHAHRREDVPPGRLETGMEELEVDGLVLHLVKGVMRPDGTFVDLPPLRLNWARYVSYHHLRREGCLEQFGIPVVPIYE